MRLSTPRGGVLEAEVAGQGGWEGIGLSRAALDESLVRHARDAGAEVFEGCRVAGAVVEGGRVVGLRARAAGEAGAFEVRAAVVVAADGRHSALVRQTGTTRARSRLRPAHFGLKRHLAVADEDAGEPAGTVGLHLVPGGYGGTCRVEGGLTNFCALLPESALRRRRGDLDRVAAEVLGLNPVLARIWAASEPVGPWKAVAGVRVELSTPRMPGILYAGDSQGTVDPLGGQGMTMALLGAESLAPVVEDALAGGGASTGLQREAVRAWRRRFDRRVALCRLFHHALVNPWLIDAAGAFPRLAPRVLAACFRQTRDANGPPREAGDREPCERG